MKGVVHSCLRNDVLFAGIHLYGLYTDSTLVDVRHRRFDRAAFPTRSKELASISRIRQSRITFNRHVKWARVN